MAIIVRKFDERDFDRVLIIWRTSREKSTNGDELAKAHPLYEDIWYFRNHIMQENQIWVAVYDNDIPVAFMAMCDEFIDCLYVEPDNWHKGIGQQLLNFALSISPGRIWLYTLQSNLRAQSFYEKYGFQLIARGVSSENLPDVTYEYIPK